MDFGKHAIPKDWFGNIDNREINKRLEANADLAYCISFHETANHFLLNVIKNRIINIGFYPKQRNAKARFATFLWNDMYGLLSNSEIKTVVGNKVVNVLYAEQFGVYQDILKRASTSEEAKRMIVEKLYGGSFLSLFNKNNVTDKVRSHIMASHLEVSPKERAFINDLQMSDNPVLQIGLLKPSSVH